MKPDENYLFSSSKDSTYWKSVRNQSLLPAPVLIADVSVTLIQLVIFSFPRFMNLLTREVEVILDSFHYPGRFNQGWGSHSRRLSTSLSGRSMRFGHNGKDGRAGTASLGSVFWCNVLISRDYNSPCALHWR